jgi:hypothetical protein
MEIRDVPESSRPQAGFGETIAALAAVGVLVVAPAGGRSGASAANGSRVANGRSPPTRSTQPGRRRLRRRRRRGHGRQGPGPWATFEQKVAGREADFFSRSRTAPG